MICERLHISVNGLERHRFPFYESCIPQNGIYLLFESGEHAHGKFDRIVRIGTHNGQNNLRQRLAEHFLAENKDRSIFRKNIGRALLNRRKDPFLSQWEIDLTTNAARRQYDGKIDLKRLSEIETEVSGVIRTSFTFCVFRVDEQQYRRELEERMIATVNHCGDCRPSSSWLGNYSPKKQIRESGLWLVQGLNGREMKDEDIDRLEQAIGQGCAVSSRVTCDVSIKTLFGGNMPSLVIHAPEYQVFENNKKSFKDTFETGVGRGYALNNTILRQISLGCRVILLCKDRECRAEGTLLKLEPGIENGEPWFTTNHIRRYNVYVEGFREVPYKSEKLNRNGVAVI